MRPGKYRRSFQRWKEPMAQATFSCPFGAIHLEMHWGPLPVSTLPAAVLTVITPRPPLRERVTLVRQSVPAGKIKFCSHSTLGPLGPFAIKI